MKLHDYLEPKAVDDIGLGPWTRKQLLMSQAISTKRIADALETLNERSPGFAEVPPTAKGESTWDSDVGEHRPWFKPDDQNTLQRYKLSDMIEVRGRDMDGSYVGTPFQIRLGDAIDWSTYNPGVVNRRLKASIAEWRPL